MVIASGWINSGRNHPFCPRCGEPVVENYRSERRKIRLRRVPAPSRLPSISRSRTFRIFPSPLLFITLDTLRQGERYLSLGRGAGGLDRSESLAFLFVSIAWKVRMRN